MYLRLVFPQGVKKGMLWKKGTFTHALQYRGHFGNGALLQQKYTDACFTLLFSFLQPYFSFLPHFLARLNNVHGELLYYRRC